MSLSPRLEKICDAIMFKDAEEVAEYSCCCFDLIRFMVQAASNHRRRCRHVIFFFFFGSRYQLLRRNLKKNTFSDAAAENEFSCIPQIVADKSATATATRQQ